jgi:hypothetical protein
MRAAMGRPFTCPGNRRNQRAFVGKPADFRPVAGLDAIV